MEARVQRVQPTIDRLHPERCRDMEKHARCALLPSPKLLETAAFQGQDVTNTLGDYAKVLEWVKTSGLLNTDFYERIEKLCKQRFGSMVLLAFNNAFAPILNTANLDCEELVFWYYAGHGLGKETIEEVHLEETSAIPRLDKVDYNKDFSLAASFMPEHHNRTVKGGELCLHHVGFCGLNGLMEAWITTLKTESSNIPVDRRVDNEKRNKHFVLILDSCYSGTFAEDLNSLARESGPWNENGCTVTVQASCNANEQTFGAYFTPLFVYLNQHPDSLNKLVADWEGMTDEKKQTYSTLPLPSPVVATTRNREGNNHPVTKIECQGFTIQLFPNPGFFKYCFLKWSQELDNQNQDNQNQERALNHASADQFLLQQSFNVLDYKLKKLSPGASRHANTRLGLFLVEDLNANNYAVCVHIHFKDDTTKVSRINLVHHLRPAHGVFLYAEERKRIQVAKTARFWLWESTDPVPGLSPEIAQQARKLVKACHDKVEDHEPGRWSDISRWNMKSSDLGVHALFRLKQHSKQRSQDLKTYLESLQNE